MCDADCERRWRVSRGLDNNNPGNIRLSRVKYKGECAVSSDTEFRQFESIEWGYRAIFMLLYTYHRRHGCRTLRQMIDRYAPPSENPTSNYLRFVSESSGIDPDYVIDVTNGRVMVEIVCAISHFENGVPANRNDVLQGWELFIKS